MLAQGIALGYITYGNCALQEQHNYLAFYYIMLGFQPALTGCKLTCGVATGYYL